MSLRLKEIKTFRIGDAFIILLLGLGSVYFMRTGGGAAPGSTIRIIRADGGVKTFPLSKDTVMTVSGPLGNTTVEIGGGAVWIAEAPCPHKTCIHQGKIRLSGQIVVCVPNRICVEVERAGDAGVDGITM
jgi:hypothetical protein